MLRTMRGPRRSGSAGGCHEAARRLGHLLRALPQRAPEPSPARPCHAIPFATLTLGDQTPAAKRRALLDTVHVEQVAVGVPPTDRIQRVIALPAGKTVFGAPEIRSCPALAESFQA